MNTALLVPNARSMSISFVPSMLEIVFQFTKSFILTCPVNQVINHSFTHSFVHPQMVFENHLRAKRCSRPWEDSKETFKWKGSPGPVTVSVQSIAEREVQGPGQSMAREAPWTRRQAVLTMWDKGKRQRQPSHSAAN